MRVTRASGCSGLVRAPSRATDGHPATRPLPPNNNQDELAGILAPLGVKMQVRVQGPRAGVLPMIRGSTFAPRVWPAFLTTSPPDPQVSVNAVTDVVVVGSVQRERRWEQH